MFIQIRLLSRVPADYDCSVSVEGLETTYADGKLTFPADAAKGQYTATLTDASGKYVSLTDTFELTVAEMPAAYDAETVALVPAENYTEEQLADFVKNIKSVGVTDPSGKTASYAPSGRGAVKIILDDGTIDLNAKDGAIFGAEGTYTLTVSATGYEKSLTFALTVGGSEAPTPEPAPEPTPTPEPDPEPTPEPEPPVADPALKAGTYTAESTCSDGNYFDYKITATVVVGEDGLIQSLAAEANEDASKNDKSFLADALEGMSAKLVGLNRAGYLDWSENYTGKGGSTAYDAVSGATYSSNSIQNAVAAAMKTAVSES